MIGNCKCHEKNELGEIRKDRVSYATLCDSGYSTVRLCTDHRHVLSGSISAAMLVYGVMNL